MIIHVETENLNKFHADFSIYGIVKLSPASTKGYSAHGSVDRNVVLLEFNSYIL